MTERQKFELDRLKIYIQSDYGVLSLMGEIVIDEQPSLKYFDGTEKGVWLTVYTVKESRYEVVTKKWCDVVIGTRGGVKGRYSRTEPITTTVKEK